MGNDYCRIIMKTFVCILAFALCVSALPRNFNAEFEAFEEKYNKNYATATERFVRFLNFQQNLKEIEAFNSENHSWKKSINKTPCTLTDGVETSGPFNVHTLCPLACCPLTSARTLRTQ